MSNKTTVVVNINSSEYDVYIGRPGKGMEGIFGNPFYESSRENNIAKYKEYFYERIRADKKFSISIKSLKGKKLGCFCKPKKCHGDIIVDYLENLQKISLAIVGSRSFDNYQYLKETVDWFLIDKEATKIISGGAKGADSLAKRYAIENGIPLVEFIPEWDKHGKSAGYLRNEKIVKNCDELIAFYDMESRGTKHSIDLAQINNKPTYIFDTRNIKINTDEIAELGF